MKDEATRETADLESSTIYQEIITPVYFPFFLKDKMEGKTVPEMATILGVEELHVERLLNGQWRPTKGICKTLGLEIVYAVTSCD